MPEFSRPRSSPLVQAIPGRRHLHFVQSLEPLQGGGLGRAALQLAQAMRDAGEDAQVVATYGDASRSGEGSLVKEFRRVWPHKIFLSPSLFLAAPALSRNADVFHAHGFYTALNWMFGAQARALRRPLVCHPHGFFEPWILSRSKLRKRLVHSLFEDANFRAAALWRALTEKEADQIRAQGIKAPIVVAANGITLSDFELDPGFKFSRKKKSRRRALFLGRLHPKKGLDMLIPAWHRAKAAKKEWELVIAGPDELGHRAELEAEIRRLGLGDSVSFAGTVTGQEKTHLLRSADLFILPSYSEGFSVAILEALACHVPVLVTDACNFSDIESESAGWICQANFDSLTETLSSVLRISDEELKQRGEAGAALVERRYTWDSIRRTISDACERYC